MYALDDDAERYSAQDTIAAQGAIFLCRGSVLMSNEGRVKLRLQACRRLRRAFGRFHFLCNSFEQIVIL
jgi:uncharacterized protein YcgI (DUF1989 family)